MAYEKTQWEPREGSDLNRFLKEQESARSVMLHNAPNSVTRPGTPFSVKNMNKIEQGIYDAHQGLEAKAPAESPVFTGEPKAPTPGISAGDDRVATMGAVRALVPNISLQIEMIDSSQPPFVTRTNPEDNLNPNFILHIPWSGKNIASRTINLGEVGGNFRQQEINLGMVDRNSSQNISLGAVGEKT